MELRFTQGFQGLDAQEQLQSLTCRPGARNTGLQLREKPGSCIPGLLCYLSQIAGDGDEWDRWFKNALLIWGRAAIQMPQFLSKARLIAGK